MVSDAFACAYPVPIILRMTLSSYLIKVVELPATVTEAGTVKAAVLLSESATGVPPDAAG